MKMTGYFMHRYDLQIKSLQSLMLGENSEFIHAGLNARGEPSIWVKESRGPVKEYEYEIAIVGTGHGIPDNFKYLNTFVLDRFVWHVYVKEML